MNILKLNLKKDIFEKVKDENFSMLDFEITPFYLSRFTTNKNNKVEDLKKDKSLFKEFDIVQFSSSGETIEYPFIGFDVNDSSISLMFKNKAYDLNTESNESDNEVDNNESNVEEVINTDENVTETEDEIESNDEEYISDYDEVENINEYNENYTEEELLDIFDSLYNKDNVFTVNTMNVRVGYCGKIWGNDKKFPSKNTHDQIVKLERKSFSTNKEIFSNEISTLSNNGYLFIFPDGIRIFEDSVEIPIKKISMLEVYTKWN